MGNMELKTFSAEANKIVDSLADKNYSVSEALEIIKSSEEVVRRACRELTRRKMATALKDAIRAVEENYSNSGKSPAE